MNIDLADVAERAVRLRRMTAELLAGLTPAERDRIMQTHLAQARGPQANALLVRQMTAFVLRLRAAGDPRGLDDLVEQARQLGLHDDLTRLRDEAGI